MVTTKQIDVRLPRPHEGQRKVLRSSARFKVVICGRRWGKSLVGQDAGVNGMLRGKQVAYVTPTYLLAKKFYRAYIKKIPKALIKSTNKSDLEITLITGGFIKFFSGEVLGHFRGWKFHLVIIDEAAYIPDLEKEWTESIRPTLTDYKGEALFISTPRGQNFFYALCLRGQNGTKGYETFHYSTYDNPHIAKSEIDEARDELPEAVFKQEYLAIAGEDANNPFGSKNIDKNIRKEVSGKPPVVYGIDLAKYNDWTVIFGLDEDGEFAYFDRFQMPWELTKDKIASLPGDVLKVLDATGVGDVILEDLITRGVTNLEGFVFTAESKPRIIYEFIKDVEKGTVTYNDITAKEMHVYEYQYSSKGKLSFNAQSGFHDDTIAAAALANHYRKYFARVSSWGLSAA